MSISRATARRRLQAAGYDAATIAEALPGRGARVRTANIGGNLGRGRANVVRVATGQEAGRDKP